MVSRKKKKQGTPPRKQKEDQEDFKMKMLKKIKPDLW